MISLFIWSSFHVQVPFAFRGSRPPVGLFILKKKNCLLKNCRSDDLIVFFTLHRSRLPGITFVQGMVDLFVKAMW